MVLQRSVRGGAMRLLARVASVLAVAVVAGLVVHALLERRVPPTVASVHVPLPAILDLIDEPTLRRAARSEAVMLDAAERATAGDPTVADVRAMRTVTIRTLVDEVGGAAYRVEARAARPEVAASRAVALAEALEWWVRAEAAAILLRTSIELDERIRSARAAAPPAALGDLLERREAVEARRLAVSARPGRTPVPQVAQADQPRRSLRSAAATGAWVALLALVALASAWRRPPAAPMERS